MKESARGAAIFPLTLSFRVTLDGLRQKRVSDGVKCEVTVFERTNALSASPHD